MVVILEAVDTSGSTLIALFLLEYLGSRKAYSNGKVKIESYML